MYSLNKACGNLVFVLKRQISSFVSRESRQGSLARLAFRNWPRWTKIGRLKNAQNACFAVRWLQTSNETFKWNQVSRMLYKVLFDYINGNWIEWSAIWSETIHVISKLNKRELRVPFEVRTKIARHEFQLPINCIRVIQIFIYFSCKYLYMSKMPNVVHSFLAVLWLAVSIFSVLLCAQNSAITNPKHCN